MDSLSQKLTNVQQDVSEKIESIKTKATEKIKSIKYPPELEDKFSKLTGSIENLSPKTIEAKLPSGLNLDKLNAFEESPFGKQSRKPDEHECFRPSAS